jgi:hypothetical protein
VPDRVYQVCFLCGLPANDAFDPMTPEVQLRVPDLPDDPPRRVLFYAHERCMRRAAHAEFVFPTHEEIVGDDDEHYW